VFGGRERCWLRLVLAYPHAPSWPGSCIHLHLNLDIPTLGTPRSTHPYHHRTDPPSPARPSLITSTSFSPRLQPTTPLDRRRARASSHSRPHEYTAELPPPRHDAYVRWIEVCAAETSAPVRPRFCAEVARMRLKDDATVS
jgi:hypothetical protein